MVPISKHFRKGRHVGFRKFVGGRNFHLGTGISAAHERLAGRIAEALVAKWQTIKNQNGQWTDEAITECFSQLDAYAVGTAAVEPPKTSHLPSGERSRIMPVEQSASMITTHGALDEFITNEKTRAERGQIKKGTCDCNVDRLNQLKQGVPNVPMTAFQGKLLEQAVGYFTSRPPKKIQVRRSKRRQSKPQTRTAASVQKGDGRLSYYTIKELLKLLKTWLKWCAKPAQRFWLPYEDWQADFAADWLKLRMKELRAAARRNNKNGFDQLTVEEARIRWKLAIPLLKCFMGIGLWCGHTQSEVASLELGHFLRHDGRAVDFVDHVGEMWIDRDRPKTFIPGRWWIPPELAEVICSEVVWGIRNIKENPRRLAFPGPQGLPLVHFGPDDTKRRTDYIAGLWDSQYRITDALGVRHLSFKYLRKTLSQRVRDKLGVEYSQVFLAQVQDDINTEHYNKSNFAKLEIAVREIYSAGWNEMFKPLNLSAYRRQMEAVKAA